MSWGLEELGFDILLFAPDVLLSSGTGCASDGRYLNVNVPCCRLEALSAGRRVILVVLGSF